MRRGPAFQVTSLVSAASAIANQLLPALGVLGFVLTMSAVTMMVPLTMAWMTNDGAQAVWIESIVLTGIAGLVMWLGTRGDTRELQTRDGFLFVSLIWIVAPAFAAIPLWRWTQSSPFPMTPTDAYFEAVSGLTTTGSTVMSGIDLLPASINLWRHLLVWFGGMGILVLAIAVLPLLGVGGSQLYKAETPGPMKETKLTPRIAETAKGLYAVYLGLTAMCMLCYHWAGMSWFDAVCHGFSTLGLGGFSTHDDSFAYFAERPWVDVVGVVFMVIASCNFAVHFNVVRTRSLRPYAGCPETRWVLLALLGGGIAISYYLYSIGLYASFGEALRYGVFNTVSIASTTGYVNSDYGVWPMFASTLVLFMSVFATSSGSTGGGIKMIRAVILVKQTRRELRRALHPRLINPIRLPTGVVENNVVFSILAFIATYMLVIIVASFVLLASGLDVATSVTAVLASINNMGMGLGSIGPSGNFASFDTFQTWVCIALMLLGRLELFTLLVVFTPGYWRR